MARYSIEQRVVRLEHSLERLRSKFAVVNKRCSDIVYNQRHYLKYRAKAVDKRQKALLDAAIRVKNKLARLPHIDRMMTTSTKHGRRSVLLVTANHARKLRVLAEMDFRRLFNTVINSTRRLRLSPQGRTNYRKTE